ncbi:MAG: S9 family peptidase, partial [Pseudomonadota bacterium]
MANTRGPEAQKRPVEQSWHGTTLVDDYAWMRADNWMEVMRDPSVLADDIRAHLEAENAHAEAWLSDTEALQETLFAEMKARIKQDDSSVPQPHGPWLYYSRYETGKQYPVFCRKPRTSDDGDMSGEHVLLDGNAAASNVSYWKLGALTHSPDHAHLAYSVDDNGSELFRLHVRDLATGTDLDTAIDDVSAVTWSADGRALVYVKVDDNHRPRWVYSHTLGTSPNDDRLIYEETDPGFFVSVGRTNSDRFIEIASYRHECSEIRVVDANDLTQTPRVIAPRRDGHEYDIDHIGDQFIITTNSGDAVDKRICVAPVDAPEEAK